MPPNVGSAPLSISITLTPIRGFGDVRNITLKPGEPCLVGRASRSTLKHLDSRSDNALFDCPVISREHAELRAHLWDLLENQVTITDNGSMHGTRVNGAKLRQGSPKTLHSGDTIQFGEKVTRGDSSHDGIMVTFTHRQSFTQESNTFAAHTPAANPSGVYRYPYTSDEESDYGSDDNVSIISEKVEAVSSAKTTPEQAKAKLGSQEQPIELDQPEKPKRTLVQDSVDVQASVIVEDSLPGLQRKATAIAIDVDSDEESIIEQKTLPPPRAASYMSIEDDADEQDDFEYPNDEEVDDIDDVSDSEASDLDHYSQLEESDEEDKDEARDYRPVSPQMAREPSPELCSSGQGRSSAPSGMSETYVPPLLAPLGSTLNRPTGGHYGSVSRSADAPLSQPSSYPTTYEAYTYQLGTFPTEDRTPHRFGASVCNGNTYYTMPDTSRWDRPPTFNRVDPAVTYSSLNGRGGCYYPPPPDRSHSSNTWNKAPSVNASSPFATAGAQSDYYPQSPKITSDIPTSPRIPSPRSPKITPALTSAAGRISIPDIVESEMEMENVLSSLYGNVDIDEENANMQKEANRMVEETAKMVGNSLSKDADASSLPTLTAGAIGKKRKADDEEALLHGLRSGSPKFISDIREAEADVTIGHEISAPAAKKAKTADPTITPTINGTLPAAPSTLASASSVAGSVAKYAAVASAGGAGMLAFLCSPASEKLLTWLS